MQSSLTKKITFSSVVLSLSIIFSLLEFPMPFFPNFLKIDISDSIIVASGLFLGFWHTFFIIFLKSIIHYFIKGSSVGVPFDQLAMFISSFVFFIFVYNIKKVTKNLLFSLIVSSFLFIISMFLINYKFLTPIYFKLLNIPLEDYFNVCLIYIPFNIIKSIINSTFIFIIYCHLQHHQYFSQDH